MEKYALVQETIEGAHPLHVDYPLLEGDLLVKDDDGTYYKHGPGLGISGFVLTPEQEETLGEWEGHTQIVGWGAFAESMANGS